MPDILIRNFPADDLARIDHQAKRVGLSRTEFLRRQLHQQAQQEQGHVAVADLHALTDLVLDLEDEDVMRDAWS